MKHFFLLFLLCLASLGAFAQQENYYAQCIAFYNLENLFDTIHDEGKNDFEYLPDGAMHWGTVKYTNKLHNMAYAISQFGLDKNPLGAAVVGVCEVENIHCLEDLVREPALADRHYQPILIEGPDRRGVDVGLLYNPDLFKVTSVRTYELKAHYADGGEVKSRLQLLVSGYLKDEHGKLVTDKLHIIVNHWPSRYGGELASRATRDTAAMLCRHIADSLMQDTRAKVIIMGDLNDDPTNHSCAEVIGAKMLREEVGEKGYFNCLWRIFDKGTGTLAYNGSWNFFDQIIITEPLLNQQPALNKWSYWKGEMFNKPFLTVPEGKDKGTPLRTHKGGVWQNGYSDHYPTMIYLIKTIQ